MRDGGFDSARSSMPTLREPLFSHVAQCFFFTAFSFALITGAIFKGISAADSFIHQQIRPLTRVA
jgi:hypothetical protein